SWEKIDEAYYVHGISQFEKRSYADALKTLSRIRNTHIIRNAQALKQRYLKEITDIKLLKNLQKQFPEDRELAHATISLIREKYPTKENIALSNQLITKFAGSKTANSPSVKTEKEPKVSSKSRFDKDYLNVSVILPFRLDQAGSSNHLRSS